MKTFAVKKGKVENRIALFGVSRLLLPSRQTAVEKYPFSSPLFPPQNKASPVVVPSGYHP